MPKLQYFEYAVLYHYKPVRDNAQNDITPDSEVIVEPTKILAVDEQTVGKLAARAIPDKYDKELNQCQVIVHPF